MSAQAGVWKLDGSPVSKEVLSRLSRNLEEFGPDGEQIYAEGPLGMLYRPFHTAPESRHEKQPYAFAGMIFVWDGRLDNRDHLIREAGHIGKGTIPDVAIVATAFRKWGVDSLSKLVGDWALSVWVQQTRQLVLARDYIGVKPLFYRIEHDTISWCSHLETLAANGDGFSLSEEYLAGYLALWPDADLTPFREIRSVAPGSYVLVHDRKLITRQYWRFDPKRQIRYRRDADYEEHFRDLFREAVRSRLRTDSRVLADLSGGFDSSSIVCMADNILKKGEVPAKSVDTFFALASDEPGETDAPYAEKVEQKLSGKAHRVELSGTRDTLSFEYCKFVATPGFGGREDLKALKSQIIKQSDYRVLLSGTGGDELLGQALDPRVLLADLLYGFRLRDFGNALMTWGLLLRRPLVHLLADSTFLVLPPAIRSRFSDIARLEPWVNRSFAKRQRLSIRQLDAAEGSLLWSPGTRDWYQTIVSLSRQMTKIRCSVEETSYPYLDQRLVEFLAAIPLDQLLRPGQRRSLLRRALGGLLPPELVARQSKTTGGRAVALSLEKHWNVIQDLLSDSVLGKLGYIDQHLLLSALFDIRNGNLSLYFLRTIKALSAELWVRDMVKRGAISLSTLTNNIPVRWKSRPLPLRKKALSQTKGGEKDELSETGIRGSRRC